MFFCCLRLPRSHLNPLVPNAPFLLPPENIRRPLWFSYVFRRQRKGTLGTNGLRKFYLSNNVKRIQVSEIRLKSFEYFRRLSTPTGFVFLQEAHSWEILRKKECFVFLQETHSSGDIEENGMMIFKVNFSFLTEKQIHAQTNLLHRTRFFVVQFHMCKRSGTQKTGTLNQNTFPIKKQLETLLFVLYHLNGTCGFHF